jgi:hypothetical protein
VFSQVILGRARYDDAVRAGRIKLDGSPELVRAVPGWLYPSRYSKYATRDAAAVAAFAQPA